MIAQPTRSHIPMAGQNPLPETTKINPSAHTPDTILTCPPGEVNGGLFPSTLYFPSFSIPC